MSFFITFEGGEGCGKSTQSRRLYRRFLEKGIPALLIHEPGVTELGKKIRQLLKWSEDLKISPVAELLLFNAARAQLVAEVISPALGKGTVVICDRYVDSTTAYQGYGRGLDLTLVREANNIGIQGFIPDITVLLDIPVVEGFTRIKNKKTDRFEKESRAFHMRVREGYLKLAAAEPERWLVIDATKSREEIASIIWQKVVPMLQRKKGV